MSINQIDVNRTRKTVSLELARKKIVRDVVCTVTSAGLERKNSESPRGIEDQTFGFLAPMLYHCATEILWRGRPMTKFIYETRPAYC